MCDYSLHAHRNRLAVEGETLVTCRFPGGSMGMATKENATAFQNTPWNSHVATPLVAVCIPPGSQLLLEDIPVRLRKEFLVKDSEFVTFTQLGYEAYTHRDGVRFENGREVLLQRLNEDQRIIVLSLAAVETEQEQPFLRVTEGQQSRTTVLQNLVNFVASLFGRKRAPAQTAAPRRVSVVTSSRRTGRARVGVQGD